MGDLYDMRKCHPTTFAKTPKEQGGATNSLGVFLSQELVRFNALQKVIKASLVMLKKAIKGLIVMSGELEDMYNCFIFQRVPPTWEKAGYPCLKPLASWTEDYFQRIVFMGAWLEDGPPQSFWLSGFFFPQGFMTGVKQSYSRKYAIAIDTLTVSCQLMPFGEEEVTQIPEDGVYIHGLYMQGARFDRETMNMAESYVGDLFNPVPVIWLTPLLVVDYKPKDVYNCPLYKTSIRAGILSTTGHSTNFVVALDVPTSENKDQLIRRGCAMLCMLDT